MRAAWFAGAAAALLLAGALRPRGEGPTPPLAQRLLGPVPTLAASVQLVRADLALRAGETGRGFALAESALQLDPGATETYSFLAYHLALERGSELREPDPARRVRWMQEGLALLDRGEARAREPGLLAYERGLYLVRAAELSVDEGLPWPGGREAALGAALEAFRRAEHPLAGPLAARVEAALSGD